MNEVSYSNLAPEISRKLLVYFSEIYVVTHLLCKESQGSLVLGFT